MRIRLIQTVLTFTAATAIALPVTAGGYYGPGYYGDPGYSITLNCRDDRALQRQLDQIRLSCSRQLSACRNDLTHQRTAYQHLIYKQQAAIGEQLAETDGPETGTAKTEYEALQQDYNRLMKAYRDLEREHRALKSQK